MDAGLNDGFIGGGLYMYVGFETGGATGEGTGCKEGSPVPADVVGSCVGAVVGSSIGGVVGSAIGGAVGSSIGGVVGSGRVVGSTILGAGVPDIVGVIVSPLIEHISASAMISQVPSQVVPPLKHCAPESSLNNRGPPIGHPMLCKPSMKFPDAIYCESSPMNAAAIVAFPPIMQLSRNVAELSL